MKVEVLDLNDSVYSLKRLFDNMLHNKYNDILLNSELLEIEEIIVTYGSSEFKSNTLLVYEIIDCLNSICIKILLRTLFWHYKENRLHELFSLLSVNTNLSTLIYIDDYDLDEFYEKFKIPTIDKDFVNRMLIEKVFYYMAEMQRTFYYDLVNVVIELINSLTYTQVDLYRNRYHIEFYRSVTTKLQPMLLIRS